MVTAIANSGVNIQLSKYNNNVYRHCIVEILAVEPGLVSLLSPCLHQSSTSIDRLA